MRPRRFDHGAILKRIRERAEGATYTDIAAEFGCSNALVRKVARLAGIPPLRTGPLRTSRYKQPAYWHDWLAPRQSGYCAWPMCDRPDSGPRDVDHDHSCCAKEKLGHERICGRCIRGLVHKGCNVEIAVLEKATRANVAAPIPEICNYFTSRVPDLPTPSELAWKYQGGPCGQCDSCKSRFKCARKDAA